MKLTGETKRGKKKPKKSDLKKEKNNCLIGTHRRALAS
jgi:RecG-like helicase